jgi:putative hydrolase of the HAD superfamily
MTLPKYETGKISEELFINALLKEAKSPKTDARTILNTWNSMLLGITKEKITLLRELKERYTLCALSNTNKTHMDWVKDHLRETYQLEDLESIFDHLFLSHEINERKPDTSYFLHVLKELDADPSAMLFIDDHLDHVQTAISMGIPSIHKPANVALDRSFLKRSGIE